MRHTCWYVLIFLAAAPLGACGTASPGGMSGPTLSGRVNDDQEPPPPEIQSNDILARDARTTKAVVKHILIGWKGLAKGRTPDPRAEARTREQADSLAVKLLERVRAGEPVEALMREFSEDPGSAQSGQGYDVTPEATLVFEFKRLSLRLDVNEAGLVLTGFGWHVIQRIN